MTPAPIKPPAPSRTSSASTSAWAPSSPSRRSRSRQSSRASPWTSATTAARSSPASARSAPNPREIEGRQALFVVNLPPARDGGGDLGRDAVRHRVRGRRHARPRRNRSARSRTARGRAEDGSSRAMTRIIGGAGKGRRLRTPARGRDASDGRARAPDPLRHPGPANPPDAGSSTPSPATAASGWKRSRAARRGSSSSTRAAPPSRPSARTCARWPGAGGDVQVYHQETRIALAALADTGVRFDVVYLDPPYASALYEPLLEEARAPAGGRRGRGDRRALPQTRAPGDNRTPRAHPLGAHRGPQAHVLRGPA